MAPIAARPTLAVSKRATAFSPPPPPPAAVAPPPAPSDEPTTPAAYRPGNIGPDKLRAIFAEFDVDGGGQISRTELGRAVHSITGTKPSTAVIDSILADIDADDSGNIDEAEFVEFFAKVNDLCELNEEVKRMARRNTFLRGLIGGYSVVNVCVFFFFTILYVEEISSSKSFSEDDTQGKLMTRLGLIISGVSLALGLCFILVVPVVRLINPREVKRKVKRFARKVPVVGSYVPKDRPRPVASDPDGGDEAAAPDEEEGAEESPTSPQYEDSEPEARCIMSYRRNKMQLEHDPVVEEKPLDTLVLADEPPDAASPPIAGFTGFHSSFYMHEAYLGDPYAQAQAAYERQDQMGRNHSFNSFGSRANVARLAEEGCTPIALARKASGSPQGDGGAWWAATTSPASTLRSSARTPMSSTRPQVPHRALTG